MFVLCFAGKAKKKKKFLDFRAPVKVFHKTFLTHTHQKKNLIVS